MAWLSNWAKRKKLEIDNTNIDSALTWFPLMVKLGTSVGLNSEDVSEIFDEVSGNELKIAFTDSSGDTQLYAEVEKWDESGEDAIIWVSKDGWEVSNSSKTTLYIYYDSEKDDNTTYIGNDADDTPTNNVWDSNFKAVYHMNQGSGSLKDSTSNNKDGTFQGDLPDTARAEKFGLCQDLDGTGDYVTVSPGTTTDHTRELWCYVDSFSDMNGLASTTTWVAGSGHFKAEDGTDCSNNNGISFDINDGDASNKLCWESLSTETWYYVAGVYDNSTGLQTLWGNSAVQSTQSMASGLTIEDVDRIGNEYDDAREFDGMIDEVRVSSTNRSSAWLKATYYSNTDQLIDWYAEETAGTSHTKDLSDNLSVSESFSKEFQVKRSLSDSMSISEESSAVDDKTQDLSDLMKITEKNKYIDATFSYNLPHVMDLVSQLRKDIGLVKSDALTLIELIDTGGEIEQALADSVTLSEGVEKRMGKNLAISFVFAESLMVDAGLKLSEAVSFTESLKTAVAKKLVDSFDLLDSIDTQTIFTRVVSDSVSFTEQIEKDIGLNKSESLLLAEVFSRVVQKEKSLSETLVISENLKIAIGKILADTIALSEILSLKSVFTKSITETISLGEQISKDIGLNKSDSLLLAEVFATITGTQEDITELLSISESLRKDFEMEESDILDIVETFSKTFIAERKLTDTLSLLESVKKKLDLEKSELVSLADVQIAFQEGIGHYLSDNIDFTENLDRFETGKRLADAVVFAEALIKDIILKTEDTLSLTEVIAKKYDLPVDDVVSLAESLERLYGLRKAEALSFQEDLKTAIGLKPSDTLTFSETLRKTIGFHLTDILDLSEISERISAIYKSLSDSFPIEDYVTPTGGVPYLQSLSESLVISEVISDITRELLLTDNLVITETFGKGISIDKEEELILDEQVGKEIKVELVDNLTLVEMLITGAKLTLTEALSLIDSLKTLQGEPEPGKAIVVTTRNKTYVITKGQVTKLVTKDGKTHLFR